MRRLIERYNLVYVEDPLDEEDFSGFKELMAKIKNKDTMIVGDDLTTTNIHRTERAFRAGAINAMIIKPNQIGSLIEVKKVVEFCKKNKIKTIFSHRSGETMDYILADLAFGFQADYIKTGIYGRERLIKLKRLIDIEKKMERVKAI
jgi:enolase